MGCCQSDGAGGQKYAATGPPRQGSLDEKTVMGRYKVDMTSKGLMGQGTSSICRIATDIQNGETVAIKMYKSSSKRGVPKSELELILQRFRRQIMVLQQLQEPLSLNSTSGSPELWSDELNSAKSSDLFLMLRDYSKNAMGEPDVDAQDHVPYVVTELGDYSLKDYISKHRKKKKDIPEAKTALISRSVVTCLAGLHAKGYVHLDVKPENLMFIGGKWKLIDVDGCVQNKSTINIDDSTVSYSPCYCAPEWANFLLDDEKTSLVIQPGLDVWSVGLTLCELVTLKPLLQPKYISLVRSVHHEADVLFIEWISQLSDFPAVDSDLRGASPKFLDLLRQHLVVPKPAERRSLAQSLSHQFFQDAPRQSHAEPDEVQVTRDDASKRYQGDAASLTPIYKGTLYILQPEGDAMQRRDWEHRDCYISMTSDLCFVDQKDEVPSIILTRHQLMNLETIPMAESCRANSFELKVASTEVSGPTFRTTFCAANSPEEFEDWKTHLDMASKGDMLRAHTKKFDAKKVAELRKMRLTIRNRRLTPEEDKKDQYKPVFKGTLYKLKSTGDKMLADAWNQREMWISRNGSFVYFSEKEKKDIIYCTNADLLTATFGPVKDGDTAQGRGNAFQIVRAPHSGAEFEPAIFAAESAEAREQWLAEFQKIVNLGGRAETLRGS